MEKTIPLAIPLKESVCSQLSQWAKEQGLVPPSEEPITQEALASVVCHLIQQALAEDPCSLGDASGEAQVAESTSVSLAHELATLRQKVEALNQRVAQLEEAALSSSQPVSPSSFVAGKSLREKSLRKQNLSPNSRSEGLVAAPPEEWLSTADAFRALGGDPENPASTISSLDGTRSVRFNTFRLWQSSESYEAFGLELNRRRRLSKKPCLRFLSHEVADVDVVRVNGETA